jgi:hypothetical protein
MCVRGSPSYIDFCPRTASPDPVVTAAHLVVLGDLHSSLPPPLRHSLPWGFAYLCARTAGAELREYVCAHVGEKERASERARALERERCALSTSREAGGGDPKRVALCHFQAMARPALLRTPLYVCARPPRSFQITSAVPLSLSLSLSLSPSPRLPIHPPTSISACLSLYHPQQGLRERAGVGEFRPAEAAAATAAHLDRLGLSKGGLETTSVCVRLLVDGVSMATPTLRRPSPPGHPLGGARPLSRSDARARG